MKKQKLVLLGAALLLGAATASAQTRVKGRVTDSHGEPVMGAAIRVAGTKIVTTTDENGNFTLSNVPASAKHLNITYIGMQAATASISGNVNVVLRDNELNEAVVVGYGTAKKLGTVVGSVKKVGGEVVEGKPVLNVADALQGQVSGMQVLNNSGDVGNVNNVSITIRGEGSVSASTTPLIVVDGTPVGVSMLSLINSSDIESVTTLKDASATSIYGSRAANGVIYITTKRGRTGEKAQVTVSQKIGWSQLANSIANPASADELLDFQFLNNIISPTEYTKYKEHGANTDWQKYGFDNAAPMYNTEIGIRGGSERTTYYLSGSYLKKAGLTQFSNIKRTTMRTNIESKVKDWLSVGINQGFSYSEREYDGYTQNGNNNIRSFTTAVYTMPRYWDPYDPESQKNHEVWGMGDLDSKYCLQQQPRTMKDIVYNGSGFVQLTPVKGLTIRSQLGLYATDTRSSRRLLMGLAAVESSTGTRSESHSRSTMWTITNTAEYKFNIGKDHFFTVLLGQEGIKSDANGFSASVSGIQDDRLALLSNGTTPENPSQSESKTEYLSFFGRADYALKEKYYANVTVRSDASSRFGKDNRTAVFVSGGLAWDIIKEDFMLASRSWLTDLRLSASVGSTGNSEIGNYGYFALSASGQYGGQLAYAYAQFPNSKLGWEKQIQGNIGIAATFFGKLHVDLNLYNRKTKNMLMSMPLPLTTGMSAQTMNIGEMSNRGVEVELGYDILKTRDWFLNFHATYAYNTNKIDKLFYDLDEWPMKGNLLCYQVGKSLNFYMPIFAGIDRTDGKPMWYKVGYKGKAGYDYNPETMTKDESQIDDLYQDTGKRLTAPHTGGFGLTLAWKGLTLTADFTYVIGKYLVDNTRYFATSYGNASSGYNVDKDYIYNRWMKPGDEAKYPAYGTDSQFDTSLLEKASFMRLKNLSLSYDLPKHWMERTKFIENVRFNFTGRNIFTVSPFKGADPEIGTNISLSNFPATRDFTLGVEVTF